ncbi:MAG: cadherin-like domain-containing protein [Acidobacteria bacterium]|nr:cadherin-like domain-containing protein [Acidobacteriota bacterium]
MRRLTSVPAFLLLLVLALPGIARAQGAMTNGANHSGAISAAGEVDEWTFTAALGDSILLSVGEVLPGGPDPDFRPWIRLRRPDGTVIGDDSGLLAAHVFTTAPVSGTYTVWIRDLQFGARPGSALGSYQLQLLQVPGALVSADDAGLPLIGGANQAGTIHLADMDAWTFTAAQNDTILLSVGEVLTSEIDPGFLPWIRLYGPNGAVLDDDNGAQAASLQVGAPLSGTYTVVISDLVFGAREGSVGGNYLLHLVKVPGSSIIPSGDDGGTMTSGENHAGRIGASGPTPTAHRADMDVWTFTAAQNDAIVLSIGEVLTSEIDPDFLPWIRLFGPNGAWLGDDSGTLAASLDVTAPLSGTYTVVIADRVFGAREGAAVGDYLLHLVKVPGSSIVPTEDEGGTMTSGANHIGRIGAQGATPTRHRADRDVWTFTAAQNDAIVLSIGEVLTSEIDPDFIPWIRLFGPNGALLGSDSGVLAASLDVVAPLSGTYTVVVGDLVFGAREGAAVGDYLLHLVKIPGTSIVPEGDDGGVMTSGANHAGRIGATGGVPTVHRADRDVWTFTALQNDAIVLSIGEVLDSEIDPGFMPWIRLFGPNGALLGDDSGALAASIQTTAPLTGTYTVVIGDLVFGAREGSAVGDYIVHLVKVPGSSVVPAGDDGGPMSNGTAHTGRIGAPGATPTLHRADRDVWTFNASSGGALTITITEPTPPPPDPDFWPWIQLFSPSGALLRSESGATTATINITAPLTGAYTVVVGDLVFGAREGAAVGDYVLSALGISSGAVPTTVADTYSTMMNTVLNIAAPGVLANDNSNGGGAMTAQLVTPVVNGTLTLNANGSFTFTPPTGFSGPTTFAYRAANSFGSGNTETVTLNVTVGPPPTAAPDEYTTTTNTPVAVPAPGVLSNDNANGGGALTAELLTTPTNGSVVLNTNGGLTYTPAAGFSGTDTFTYRAVSAFGVSAAATVTMTVTPVTTTEPMPVTNFYVAHVSGNLVTLRWTPPVSGAAPTNYVVEGGIASGQTLASIATGGTTPLFTFAAPTGAFYVRLHTLSGGARSAASNEVRLFVNAPQPPSAPADLVAWANGSSIALAWRNTFGGGAPGGVVLDVTGSLNATLSLGLTESFRFDGVPNGTYTLRLRAVNAAGSSTASNPVTLQFPSACTGAPQPPGNFLAYRVGNHLSVVWDPATSGSAPTSFVVNVTGAFNGTLGTPGRSLSGFVGPGAYNLSVVAINPCGASAPTAVQTIVVP